MSVSGPPQNGAVTLEVKSPKLSPPAHPAPSRPVPLGTEDEE